MNKTNTKEKTMQRGKRVSYTVIEQPRYGYHYNFSLSLSKDGPGCGEEYTSAVNFMDAIDKAIHRISSMESSDTKIKIKFIPLHKKCAVYVAHLARFKIELDESEAVLDD